MPAQMQPTPTNPWGGLEVFDWKNPDRMRQRVGTVATGANVANTCQCCSGLGDGDCRQTSLACGGG